ncbi:MAG: fatty acid desaturase [Desulfobacteraceae bacterium]|nr:fatty acid desaturase [Desulfobacteraceae bacterium]
MYEQKKTAVSSGDSPGWYQNILQFQRSDRKKALWQLSNTVALYALSWCLMVMNFHWFQSIWIHIGIVIVAAGLLIRIFIFFHDCCHQSFFSSRRANTILGHILGVLTFTPYESWRRSHGIHHNTVSDLDRRGKGDIWTLTVEEYMTRSRFKRMQYRLFRNPLIMFILGPAYVFLVLYRFPEKGDRHRQIKSLHITNAGIAAVILAASWLMGWQAYLLAQLPILFLAGVGGIWLFYVQHQFEGVYWARHNAWDPLKASLEGSSFYQLPKLLQWFSGNIGFHHIHHMRPRIPNYHLQECHKALTAREPVVPLKMRDSLRSLRLKLWDEKQNRLVGFGAIKARG